MSDNLKPCPFCGASAYLETIDDIDGAPVGYLVMCSECDTVGKGFYESKDAIAQWNTRPAEDALAREDKIETMQREIDSLTDTFKVLQAEKADLYTKKETLRQEHADLQVIFRRVSDELIKARNRIIELEAQNKRTYCAYCGAEFLLDDDAASQVSDHIKTCDKHPMRQVEAELKAAKELIAQMGEVARIANENWQKKWKAAVDLIGKV